MTLPPPRVDHPTYPNVQIIGTHIVDLYAMGIEGNDSIIVSLPWSYDDDPYKKHPVVYLCDAFWDFELVWSIYNELRFDEVVPEYILVGLSYSGSDPDVDALRKADLKPSSQGSDYLMRLQRDIIPFVESQYPADPSARFIAGISIGGLFGLESLFSEPGLFQGAIALSLNPNEYDRWIYDSEKRYCQKYQSLKKTLLNQKAALPARVFMAVGEKDQPDIMNSAKAFDAHLSNRNYRFFDKKFRIIEGEKHGGVFAEGMNRGLRHMFAPYVENQ